jgi:hypothetical protein
MAKNKLVWLNEPERGDYDAAFNYLSLIESPARARSLVKSLRSSPTIERLAKDLLRASELPLLPTSETKVREDLKKIAKGKRLAPVLLITGDMSEGIPLVVADGYHRICAAGHFDEDAIVQCRMTRNRPSGTTSRS